MSNHLGNEKGLTLVELMVSSFIAITMLMSSSHFIKMIFQTSKKGAVREQLYRDMRVVTEFLSNDFRQVGGGSLPLSASIWVEDDCAARGPFADCQNSDRVTFASLDASTKECPITGAPTANSLQISVVGGCCLTSDFQSQQGMVVNQGFYRQVYYTSVDLATCQITLASGQGHSGMSNPPGAPTDWVGGVVAVVNLKTLYMDNTNNELKQFEDANNDGNIQTGELSILAADVYDFQVALGLDTKPMDGWITDTNNTMDEWLFNSAGDAMGVDGLLMAEFSDLRMISFGLIVGRRTNSLLENQISVFNGPIRQAPEVRFAKATSKVKVRNISLGM